MRVGNPHTRQERLVEVRDAGHLAQWSHLQSRRVHVDEEIRDPAVLGDVPVRTRQQNSVIGDVSVRVPHLLAVDDPFVAVALGARRQAGEVRSRARLREQLAPHLVTAEHRADEALLLPFGAVGEDRGEHHAVTDREQPRVDVVAA